MALAVSLCSCSETDPPTDTQTPPPDQGEVVPPITGVDYKAFKSFLATCIQSCDYCTELKQANGKLTMKCRSSKTISIDKDDTPFVTIGTDGNWTVDGKATSVSANYPEVGCKDPMVTTAASGNLLINGNDLGVKAGKTLRCVIDARKRIYFGFNNETAALGSEIYCTYNPVLRPDAEHLNILFIGNSFTMDATDHLPGLITAAELKNINMTRLYHGGYTLPEYVANAGNDKICARRNSTTGSTWWDGNNALNSSLQSVLDEKAWDIVVIQEHTGRSEGWVWPGTLKGAVSGLVSMIHKAQPYNRPTIVYLMSQTYSNGSTVLTKQFGNNRKKMFDTTTNVARHLLDETFIDILIPSGTVLENLRTTSLNTNELQLTRDSYHMDLGISCYAAACAVFETIITPCTGARIEDNPYRYPTSSDTKGQVCTPVTDANAPIAQRAAHEAVMHPFEVTDLSAY